MAVGCGDPAPGGGNRASSGIFVGLTLRGTAYHGKDVTGRKDREAVVGEKPQLITAHGEGAGYSKRTRPGSSGTAGSFDQLTYIQSIYAVLSRLGRRPIQSVVVGCGNPTPGSGNVPPAGIVAGLTLKALTVNVKALEVPPPCRINHRHLSTPRCGNVAGWNRRGNLRACSQTWWLRAAPFQRTTEPETKLLPLTVKVNAALPPMHCSVRAS